MPFDFAAVSAPFRMQPGLRRLDPGAPQLTPSRPGGRALREKLAVLSAWPQQALLSAPDYDAAGALASLGRHAAHERPQAWKDGADSGEARLLGWSVRAGQVQGDGPAEIGTCLAALPHPWRLAGLLCLAFEEDFAVIDGATARIPWLAVCLPSHWAPEEKVGRHFAEVHAPVADNAVLIAASQHLARLVTGPERWERFVWTITREPRLHQHPRRGEPPAWAGFDDPDALAAGAYFRTERQTFIPLPESAQAVFTIHVDSQPLSRAIDTPGKAKQVHAALSTMSPAVLDYRGLAPARDALLAWLTRRAGAP